MYLENNVLYYYMNSFRRVISSSFSKRKSSCLTPSILTLDEVTLLCNEIINPNVFDHAFLLHHLKERILPGVDETSRMKANFLHEISKQQKYSPILQPEEAVDILGTMQGGYSIPKLIDLLDDETLGTRACDNLSQNILIFDYYYDVVKKHNQGNVNASNLLEKWANGTWFTKSAPLKDKITLTAFKVTGEINTDDLSPAQDAWSRPDIPLHAMSMLKVPRDNIFPDDPYNMGPIETINELKSKGHKIAFVGDVVGTGSSRKSATNSILWHFGDSIPNVPNKNYGGVCIGGKIAPIFFNTMEDSGALPIEMDVSNIKMGDVIDIFPYQGIVKNHETGELIDKWSLKNEVLLDSVRAKGRINLIIGKSLTEKSQKELQGNYDIIFVDRKFEENSNVGFTLAQKMVGKACGKDGILPGNYCEPTITTVGSQDTTGPMTRDELKDIACLGFSSDLVMQSFCHTAAYPKPIDVVTHNTLPEFITTRGGVSLKPGDGIIHSWLNRMLLPDTVGTGGDSHTRFPLGISFPAGSGLVSFAAATGVMPLDMPESVLVKFTGSFQEGITIRDAIHYIPYVAIQKGLLTIDKQGKKNVFAGRIIEIEGLPNLKCEQAFEFADATAERSASGCTIKLDKEPIIEYLTSNITLLKWMIENGYQHSQTIQRRIENMQKWIDNPVLMERDDNAVYVETIEINLDELKEPVLCAPNDPDKAVLLSDVAGENIDEVFIGSCMTNIGHFRTTGRLLKDHSSLKSKLWISPPTKMDEQQLIEEGYYEIYTRNNVALEIPGCSLCMGNQARVNDKATVLSTSTRNFPNRLGKGANVYLASAELSAITAIIGKIPDYQTYMNYYNAVDSENNDYLNFHMLPEYVTNTNLST